MEEKIIYINDKRYKVLIAKTEEEKNKGLSDVESMDVDEGMLFDYSSNPQTSLQFNTKNMDFPIDIIFINDDDEVVATERGNPKSNDIIECEADDNEKLKYVLEVNINSDIQIGDELDFEEDYDNINEEEINKMYILDSKGNPQMTLLGGERIFSRKNSKIIIKKAKKANKLKTDNAYKSLGKYIFKVLKEQDEREPEYIKV